jgi:hypothetical protein
MNKKKTLGKVVKQYKGYNIRIALKDNSGKKDDNGTFTICGGKLVKMAGFKSVVDAVAHIDAKL